MIIEKRFDIQVGAEGEKVSKTFELDKTITVLKGLRLGANKEAHLYYRGTQRIEINGQEILPEGYESKYLMSSINIPLDMRYKTLDNLAPGNGKIKLEYTDNTSGEVVFAAYRVSLYILCEGE